MLLFGAICIKYAIKIKLIVSDVLFLKKLHNIDEVDELNENVESYMTIIVIFLIFSVFVCILGLVLGCRVNKIALIIYACITAAHLVIYLIVLLRDDHIIIEISFKLIKILSKLNGKLRLIYKLVCLMINTMFIYNLVAIILVIIILFGMNRRKKWNITSLVQRRRLSMNLYYNKLLAVKKLLKSVRITKVLEKC